MNDYYYDCSELDSIEQMEMEEALRILNAVPNFDDLEEDDWEEDDWEEDAY